MYVHIHSEFKANGIFVFDSHQKYVPHMERVEPPQGVTIGILY